MLTVDGFPEIGKVKQLQEDAHLLQRLVRQRDGAALLLFQIRGEHLLKHGRGCCQKGLAEVKLLSLNNECDV